jgi:hypothetical protein
MIDQKSIVANWISSTVMICNIEKFIQARKIRWRKRKFVSLINSGKFEFNCDVLIEKENKQIIYAVCIDIYSLSLKKNRK